MQLSKHRKRIIAATVLIIFTAAVTYFASREPRFEGRSLSGWLNDPGLTVSERERGVRAIGAKAIPFLEDWVSTTGPSWLDKQAESLNERQSVFQFDSMSDVDWQATGMRGFYFLGELAQPAQPWLIDGLNRRDSLYEFHATALILSGKEGLRAVMDRFSKGDVREQTHIVFAVHAAMKNGRNLADTYRIFLKDADPEIRSLALDLLLQLGRCPVDLLPDIRRLQNDPALTARVSQILHMTNAPSDRGNSRGIVRAIRHHDLEKKPHAPK